MKALLLLSLLVGCAYGNAPDQQEQHYGVSHPNSDNIDAGSGNWGGDDSNGLPKGCYWEDVIENQQLVVSFVICADNPQMAFKWLVDPPIDHKK